MGKKKKYRIHFSRPGIGIAHLALLYIKYVWRKLYNGKRINEKKGEGKQHENQRKNTHKKCKT